MALGQAVGGAFGMGGGQRSQTMMRGQSARPQMGGFMQQPKMGGMFGRMMQNPQFQQMNQERQLKQQNPQGYNDWMMRKPPVGIAAYPKGSQQAADFNQRMTDWRSQMPQLNTGGPQQPGIGPNPQGNAWGRIIGGIFGRGRNTGIAGGMNYPGTPPYFPPNQAPQSDGGVLRPQVQGPNGESPNQQKGGFDSLRQLLEQFSTSRGGGAMTQGGPANDPRWTNGTWGTGPARQRAIAPQLSMMPQMMRRQPQPQMMEEEEMY
jgi:hypothetical protein